MTDCGRRGSVPGGHVAAGEDPGVARHLVRSDHDCAVPNLDVRDLVEQAKVDVLPECEHDGVGVELLELAGGLRESALVEPHLLHRDVLTVGRGDRRQPLHPHAFGDRSLEVLGTGRHLLAVAAVDDDGVGGP